MKIYYIVMALMLWLALCFTAVIYIDWISDAFRRWQKLRKIAREHRRISQ